MVWYPMEDLDSDEDTSILVWPFFPLELQGTIFDFPFYFSFYFMIVFDVF